MREATKAVDTALKHDTITTLGRTDRPIFDCLILEISYPLQDCNLALSTVSRTVLNDSLLMVSHLNFKYYGGRRKLIVITFSVQSDFGGLA